MSLSTHGVRVLTVGHMGGTQKSVKAIKGKFSAARYEVQMGCETPIIKDDKSAEYLELRRRGQLLRGDFLDAFARLESAVMQYIGRTDVKASPGQPFSQKLVLLQKARERFRNPKRLDVRIAAIQQLLPVRADIVHSIFEVAILFDGRTTSEKYCFRNSSNILSPPRLIASDDLVAMTRRLNQLADQFSQQRLKEAAASPI